MITKKVLKMLLLIVSFCLLSSIILLIRNEKILHRVKSYTGLISIQNVYSELPSIACYSESSDMDGLEYLDPSEPTVGRSIFFLETSCFNSSGSILKARQACAVESAAKMNPDMTVYLLYLSPLGLTDSSMNHYKQLQKYTNIKVRRLLINHFISNTPLEEWYYSGILKTSLWPNIHTADFLRYLTLWKYGGFYLDLDMIVVKSLQNLTNFAGSEDSTNIACAIIGLENFGSGKEIANECLNDLRNNFQGQIWGNNCLGVISRSLQKICGVQSSQEMTPEKCKGFKLFPPSAFYPISYPSWEQYFRSDALEKTMEKIKDSLTIHVWNKLSKKANVKVGDKVPYGVMAEGHCPEVYNHCGEYF